MLFECKRCGACCSPGFLRGEVVYAAAIARKEDREIICEKLEMTDEELCKKFRINPPDGHMRLMEEPCRFLGKVNDDGERLCSIYGYHPFECKEHPRKTCFKNAENKLINAAQCPGFILEPEDAKELCDFVEGLQNELRSKAGIGVPPGIPTQ